MSSSTLNILWRETDRQVLRGLFCAIQEVGDPSVLMDYGKRWTEASWSKWACQCATLIGVSGGRLAGCFVLDFVGEGDAVLHVVSFPGLANEDSTWFWNELRRQYPGVTLHAYVMGPGHRHVRLSALRRGFRRVGQFFELQKEV